MASSLASSHLGTVIKEAVLSRRGPCTSIGLTLEMTYFCVGGSVALCLCARLRGGQCTLESWPKTLCRVLGQDTNLTVPLSLRRLTNGYR